MLGEDDLALGEELERIEMLSDSLIVNFSITFPFIDSNTEHYRINTNSYDLKSINNLYQRKKHDTIYLSSIKKMKYPPLEPSGLYQRLLSHSELLLRFRLTHSSLLKLIISKNGRVLVSKCRFCDTACKQATTDIEHLKTDLSSPYTKLVDNV